MAHIAKYAASACGGMCAHYGRAPELEGGYVRENIDVSLTPLNYNLAPDHGGVSQVDFINGRISELNLKRAPRKDAIRMCDCVVTIPGSLDLNRAHEFFASAYEFLSKRYGEGNVISSWVHHDEPAARPHMHFAWVPVTPDGRLSAKDVVSRKDLKTLHGDMQAALERDLGCKVEVILDPEKKGEKELSRLDQADYRAAKDAAKAARREAAAAREDAAKAARECDTAMRERDRAASAAQAEQARLEGLQRISGELESIATAGIPELASRAAVRGLGDREAALAGEVEGLRGRVGELEQANRRARERVEQLDRDLPGLRARCRELADRFGAVERRVTDIIARMREVPAILSDWALDIAHRLGKRTYDPRSWKPVGWFEDRERAKGYAGTLEAGGEFTLVAVVPEDRVEGTGTGYVSEVVRP